MYSAPYVKINFHISPCVLLCRAVLQNPLVKKKKKKEVSEQT